MSFLGSNVLVGLPALIGVVCGLKLYADGWPSAPYVVVPLLVLIAVLYTGKWAMRYVPRVARLLIELWVLSTIPITALATAVIMWVTIDVSLGWLIDVSVINPDNQKTLKGAFIAAVSTYVALVWTKDIGDGKGYFWPGTQFKDAIEKAFGTLAPTPAGNTAVYQATFQDVVEGQGNLGWSLPARGVRAGIFADYLAAHPPAPPNPNP